MALFATALIRMSAQPRNTLIPFAKYATRDLLNSSKWVLNDSIIRYSMSENAVGIGDCDNARMVVVEGKRRNEEVDSARHMFANK